MEYHVALGSKIFATARKIFPTRKIFRRRENFEKTRSGRRDRFRQKIVKIGAILAIFGPFEVSALDSTLDSTLDSGLDSALDSALNSALDSAMDSALDSTLDLALDSTLDSMKLLKGKKCKGKNY